MSMSKPKSAKNQIPRMSSAPASRRDSHLKPALKGSGDAIVGGDSREGSSDKIKSKKAGMKVAWD